MILDPSVCSDRFTLGSVCVTDGGSEMSILGFVAARCGS